VETNCAETQRKTVRIGTAHIPVSYCCLLLALLILLPLYLGFAAGAEAQQVRYAVQTGVFVGPIQSNRLAEELSLAGYAAWVEERHLSARKTRYYVLVGPFTDRAQARDTLYSIARKFKIEPFIIDLDHY
jgi:hypothetical protein